MSARCESLVTVSVAALPLLVLAVLATDVAAFWLPLQNVQAWVNTDEYSRTVRYKVFGLRRQAWQTGEANTRETA